MIKSKKINPVKIFSKKPLFYMHNNLVYIVIKNLIAYNNIYEIVKKPNDISYMILLGKIGKNKINFYKNIPELTLPQMFELCKFLYKINNKKFTYEYFSEYLIQKNIIKKELKNNNHIFPQNRYKTSELSYMAGLTSKKTKFFITNIGLKYIFNSSEIGMKKFIEYFQ